MKHRSTFSTLSLMTVTAALLLLIAAGCRNTGKKESEEPSVTDTLTEDTDARIEDISGYPIPDSYQITQMIYEAGAPYVNRLSNGPEKADEYVTPRDKALNMGVYGTDLIYATTYMMRNATLEYLDATKILIDELGISALFSMTYAERIEQNLENRDSLIQVVTETFDQTWNYLVENEQDIQARLVVSGSWIEGLYITSNIAKTALDNTVILEILANQKHSLEELISLLEPVKDREEIADIYTGLSDIHSIYQEVGETLTNDQLNNILSKISSLRNSIV